MPKETKAHKLPRVRSRSSPYPPSRDLREWEEIRCPICLDHPHNAVLLHCSSHNNGCRPYICNTSSRHSNCLQQFRNSPSTNQLPKFSCPLCRGEVHGWSTVEALAREFMNSKPRSCSCETCGFNGNYSELQAHVVSEHPAVRPARVDPERRRQWDRLVLETDLRDTISAMLPENDIGRLQIPLSFQSPSPSPVYIRTELRVERSANRSTVTVSREVRRRPVISDLIWNIMVNTTRR